MVHSILINFFLIVDILTRILVDAALEWDKKENLNKAPKDRSSKHLSDLLDCIHKCGMTFNVWEKENADGKGSGMHEFTNLMGSEKKKLMGDLPDKLHRVIKPTTSDSVVKMWKVIS